MILFLFSLGLIISAICLVGILFQPHIVMMCVLLLAGLAIMFIAEILSLEIKGLRNEIQKLKEDKK